MDHTRDIGIHQKTIRKEIAQLLSEDDLSARDLSQAIGIREKDVYHHLAHVARSVAAQGKKLIILPFNCLACGYLFEERKRYTRPGRCPRCKKTHVEVPLYRVE